MEADLSPAHQKYIDQSLGAVWGSAVAPMSAGPARPGVQPCGDATWMVVPVTEGNPGEVRAARTLDKSMLV